jgi:asparagine synthase (glutamine-hydrolysing)
MSDYYYGLAATPETPFNRQKGSLYKNDFSASLGNYRSDQPTRDLFSRVDGKSTLQKMLYVDTKSWLPDDLLVKADKMTMATSVRVPAPSATPPWQSLQRSSLAQSALPAAASPVGAF